MKELDDPSSSYSTDLLVTSSLPPQQISNVTYLRTIFPEHAFGDRCLEGGTLICPHTLTPSHPTPHTLMKISTLKSFAMTARALELAKSYSGECGE